MHGRARTWNDRADQVHPVVGCDRGAEDFSCSTYTQRLAARLFKLSRAAFILSVPIMLLTTGQTTAIEVAERVSSVLSLLGASFTIITFLTDKAFHKPINRLVFYAAWGNVLGNIFTLIGAYGVSLGEHSPLCQLQGFMLQL